MTTSDVRLERRRNIKPKNEVGQAVSESRLTVLVVNVGGEVKLMD